MLAVCLVQGQKTVPPLLRPNPHRTAVLITVNQYWPTKKSTSRVLLLSVSGNQFIYGDSILKAGQQLGLKTVTVSASCLYPLLCVDIYNHLKQVWILGFHFMSHRRF